MVVSVVDCFCTEFSDSAFFQWVSAVAKIIMAVTVWKAFQHQGSRMNKTILQECLFICGSILHSRKSKDLLKSLAKKTINLRIINHLRTRFSLLLNVEVCCCGIFSVFTWRAARNFHACHNICSVFHQYVHYQCLVLHRCEDHQFSFVLELNSTKFTAVLPVHQWLIITNDIKTQLNQIKVQ